MIMLYWFAFIVGGGLLLLSVVGDFGEGAPDDLGGNGHLLNYVSLRSVTYLLFGFGASGLLVTWLGNAGALGTAAIAAGTGVAVAAAASALLGWLRRTEAGEREDESSFVGLPGTVTLPLAANRSGRVTVQRGARAYELRARPYESDAAEPERWTEVVVVDMADGTALVSPVDPGIGLLSPGAGSSD